MKKITLIISTLLLLSCIASYGQELRATVTVNSDRIQGTNKDVFNSLQDALNNMINGYQWSSATFATNERINCTFSVVIQEQVEGSNNYKAELYVMATRPVYNSSYTTTLLNWRDTSFEFEYQEGYTVQMQDNYINTNLVATIAFYCNLILGLDFDSFSPLGGSVFLRQAQSLATSAQASGWSGWSAFDDNRSRTSIINCLNEEGMKPFRQYWYTYHRRGLDEMAANADRSRTTILGGLSTLKDAKNTRGSEIILQMFADCKLDEIVSVAEKASTEEKKETYDLLKSIFPTQGTALEPLKK